MDESTEKTRVVVDLSFLIFEGLLTGGVRGIQRVQIEIARSLFINEQAVFCIYAFGAYREISNQQVKAILSLDYSKRHMLTAALGLNYQSDDDGQGIKKAQIAPQVTRKFLTGTFSGFCETWLFKLGKRAFAKRYDFITGKPTSLPVFNFEPNDTLVEIGLVKDPNKIRDLEGLRQTGLKFAYVVHDLFHLSHSYVFRDSKKYQQRLRATFKQVDQLICVSHYTLKTLNEWSPFLAIPLAVSAKAKVIHLSGRPTSLWKREGNENQRLGESPYFLAIGNIEPRKNYPVLFEALKQLDLRALNHKLIVLSRQTAYVDAVMAALDENPINKPFVQIVSDLDDVQLKALIQNCSFLIHPALMEGFGLPPLEAMAEGRLPLISDAGAMQEFCQGAMVFPSLDSSACAAAITQACNMSEEEKAQRIADNAFKDRTWDDVAAELFDTLTCDHPRNADSNP